MNTAWPWLIIALLGAYHGLNPGMGWLFALSFGLQEKSQRSVLRALVPIALGHALAIALTILAVRFAQEVVSGRTLELSVAALLFAMCFYRLFRARHPRGWGMRVGSRDLFVWSFLMAGGHGAGLMLAPILLAQPVHGMSHSMHTAMPGEAGLSGWTLGLAVVIHTLSLLLVAGILALAVYRSYETSGLKVLQNAWFNFDFLWAAALFVAGVATLLT